MTTIPAGQTPAGHFGRPDLAAILEDFAADVIALPGVSRRNPHEFAEAKSDLCARMRRKAFELRTVPAVAAPRASVSRLVASVSGPVLIGQRLVSVEVRRRRPRLSAR